MKTIFMCMLLLFYSNGIYSIHPAGKTSLSGIITDKETGSTIPGVTIYIPDLKTGTVSKIDGSYLIENLPATSLLVQVNFLGYKTLIETVDLSQNNIKNFSLETSVKEINEIVVTGHSQAGEKNRTPTPVSIVTKTQLLQNASGNIIDAIATQPGISQVTTGSGISKPEIRGLGYNRVVVVNDGIRQEGQQWGDEHGVEIDEFSVSRVEILKGPASLVYGSDAMAGVINMISTPTIPEGTVQGNFISNYQTNNGLFGYSGNIAGNRKGILWDLRYSDKRAHAYQNKYDGYVYNSGFSEKSLSGLFGLNKAWGYSHLQFSAYQIIPGLVEGERDSASGKFTKPLVVNDTMLQEQIADNRDFKSYKTGIPYQQVDHLKAVLNNSFILGRSSLKLTLGIQQNQRREFADPFHPSDYGLYFLMNTVNYDLHYNFPEIKNWQASIGINGMQQSSKNKGEEFLVPEYSLSDIGEFFSLKKSFDKLDISGGIRYDNRKISTTELLLDSLGKPSTAGDPFSVEKFGAFSTTFSDLSGSIGATYQFSEKLFTKINLSRGFRAPNIAELGSNGEHEGTGRYEIGQPAMKAESSLQLDFALGLNTEHISAEIDLFENSIDHFIYTEKLNSYAGGDSIIDPTNPIPTFRFTQGKAQLMGGEFTIDIHPHPLDWLHFENSFSYVRSVQEDASDSTKYLPFTPPAKFQSELRADFKKIGGTFGNSYLKLGLENYFAQNSFYAAYGTETATPAYTLLNAGLGTELLLKSKSICSVYISVNNLLDVAYQSHLSRLKYAPENYATGRTGVYNMGRNVSFKILIPINFRT